MRRALAPAIAMLFTALLAHAAEEGTITLGDAIEAALKNHPSMAAAREAVNASRAQSVQAASPYLPHVAVSTGYAGSHATTALGDSVTRGTSTTLSASQVLYDFGRTGNALDAARFTERSSELDGERVQQEVVLNVKQAYFGLLRSNRLLLVAEKDLERTEAHLAQAQAFFHAGSRPRFDVTRAEVDVNSARLAVLNAKNTVRLSKITLNNAMGAPQESAADVEDVPFAPEALPALDNLQKEALRNRPEMRRADEGLNAADARLRAERAQYFPSITANGSYTWQNGISTMGTYRADLGSSWNAGVTLNLSLFEGGVTRGRVAEARANYLAARAQREALAQNVLLEVNQAFADLENARARMDVMESSLAKAKENLTIAEGRYEAGVGPHIEVIDARLAELNAEVDSVQARYDCQLAAARLEKAVGRIDGAAPR